MDLVPGGNRPPTSIVGWRGLLALGAGLLVLILLAASAAWQAERNNAALARSSETQAARSLVSDILISAQNAETGQRGYLLTRDRRYLAPFDDAQRQMPAQLARLRAALPADERLAPLRQAVDAKLSELHRTIDLLDSGQDAAALALVRTNSGQAEMARIRDAVAAIAGVLDAQLAKRAQTIRSGGRLLVTIDLLGLALVTALATLIAIGARAYLASLAVARKAAAEAYHALEISSDRLDDIVRFRTAGLVAANEEIQRFAHIVSHDLRAPLVNIMGFTGELEQATAILVDVQASPGDLRQTAAEDIREALRFIKASTSKMDRLIKAILKLSREGRRVLTAEPLAMGSLLHTVLETLGHQALAVDIAIAPLPDIAADRVAVEQIFCNVVENALKYLDPARAGTITIDGQVEGHMASYDVRDNGRGIDPRDFERVFELFRRAGDQTIPGEGIGLAHVRTLVRRLGGSIDCTSTLGVGTTFTIRLPLMADYAAHAH